MSSVEGGRDERRHLAEGAIERVMAGLDAVLGDHHRVEPGKKRPNVYDQGLVVRPYDLTERCPSRAAQPATGEFAWSARTARRQIGLGALRLLDDDSSDASDLGAAITEVLSNRSTLGMSLAGWLDELGRPGIAAVSAAALTWASGVRQVVPPDPRVRWADPTAGARWDVPDRLVRVVANLDASMGGVVTGEVLLLVADSDADSTDRMRAAHLALVRSVLARHAPVRVTVAAPSRGVKVQVEVDRDLLDLAADRLVEHVALRVDPAGAPTRPGRWCDHCHLLEVCHAGRARGSAHPDIDLDG